MRRRRPSPRALVTLAVAMDDAEPGAPPMPDIVLLEGQTPDEAARAYCGDNGLDLEAVAPELAKVLADNLASAPPPAPRERETHSRARASSARGGFREGKIE